MAFSINSITDKDLRKLARKAAAQGWEISITGTNHIRFKSPTGDTLTTALTPSSQATFRNFKATMVRVGYVERTAPRPKAMTVRELAAVLQKEQPEASVAVAIVDETGKEILYPIKILRADGSAVTKIGLVERSVEESDPTA